METHMGGGGVFDLVNPGGRGAQAVFEIQAGKWGQKTVPSWGSGFFLE